MVLEEWKLKGPLSLWCDIVHMYSVSLLQERYGHDPYGPPSGPPPMGPPPPSRYDPYGPPPPGPNGPPPNNYQSSGASPPGAGMLQQGAVLMVYGLSPDKMNATRIFNVFCLYGNVVRVRIPSRMRPVGGNTGYWLYLRSDQVLTRAASSIEHVECSNSQKTGVFHLKTPN